MPREPDRKRPCPCGSGRSYFACCRPKERARAEAAEAARAACRRVDGALDALLPVVQESYAIACGPGCNACCPSFIRTLPAEAAAIAEWLADDAHAPVRERFLSRLPEWRARVGDEVGVIDRIAAAHGGAPRPDDDDAPTYAEAMGAYFARDAMCPFNDERGWCSIYEVRPLPCRVTLVVDSAEFCKRGAPHGPKVVRPRSLQDAIQAARAGIARAPRPDGATSERVLPEAVAEALARRGFPTGG